MRPLSKRETDVLALIAAAKSDREIAVALGIAHDTVRGYTKSIYRKLGVHKRAAAAMYFHESNTGTEKAD